MLTILLLTMAVNTVPNVNKRGVNKLTGRRRWLSLRLPALGGAHCLVLVEGDGFEQVWPSIDPFDGYGIRPMFALKR